jgi:ABC-type enterobactin transport system permease subunit
VIRLTDVLCAYYLTAEGWAVLAAIAFLTVAGPRISNRIASKEQQ